MGSPAEANLEANFLLNLQFEFDLSIQKSVLQDEREDKKYKLNLAQKIYKQLCLLILIVIQNWYAKTTFNLIYENYKGKNHNAILHISNGVSIKRYLPINELIEHSFYLLENYSLFLTLSLITD